MLPRLAPLALALAASTAAAQAPVPVDLRVERQSAPDAVGSLSPRLSWRIVDADRGAAQSAYELLVASSPALLDANTGDVVDTGMVAGGRSVQVPWPGTALASDTRYWWKVRLWDDQDVVGPWSETATFRTGLAPGDVTAQFVWDGTSGPNDTCYLRRSVALAGPVEEALVHVTAHEEYRLWINGAPVGRGPAQTDPYARALVNTYDVTELLVPGENVIAARAHYRGAMSGCGVSGEPAFWLQARIELAGGGTVAVDSGPAFRVLAATPYSETSPFRGPVFARATLVEDFDARLEPVGWRLAGFDDSAWAAATVVTPAYPLVPQEIPGTVVRRVLTPALIDEPVPDVWLVDFGANEAGWFELDLAGQTAGDVVTVWSSEEVSGDRIVRDRDRIDDNHDRYVARGDALEVWAPDIRYTGFRYLEIEGLAQAPTTGSVRLVVSGTELEPAGSFESSSPRYGAIHSLSVRTQESCAQGALVDCPQREQTQYVADGLIQGVNLFYGWRDSDLMAKLLRDIADSELGGGVLRPRYPSDSSNLLPEWSLLWIEALWTQHRFADDPELVAGGYGTVQAMLDSFDAFRDPATDLLTGVPGAAYAWGRLDTQSPTRTPLNAVYHRARLVAAEMADMLGLPLDADQHRAIADLVRAGMNAHLFDGVRRYRDGLGSTSAKCGASALALWSGVVPPEREAAVLAYVEGFPHGPDAFVTSAFAFEALVERDRTDAIHRWLSADSGLFGPVLAAGSTTAWEYHDGIGSLSHAWSAFPLRLFPAGVVGVAPTSPGFASFDVRPHLGDLDDASATVPTPYGEIEASWRRLQARLEHTVVVPPNTTARVFLPTEGWLSIEVTEGGTPVWSGGAFLPGVAGVQGAALGPRYLRVDLVAGTYRLRLTGLQASAVPIPGTPQPWLR